MTAKILDNIVLASWTSVCKSTAINAETMDTEEEDELEKKTEDRSRKLEKVGRRMRLMRLSLKKMRACMLAKKSSSSMRRSQRKVRSKMMS